MKRRSLLSLLIAGSTANALASQRRSGKASATKAVLVLLELRGGNDGLNTLAPVSNPIYQRARPRLALNKTDALTLNDDLALHPALLPLLPLWRSKRLGFALGVGWPDPNRSHFKAADQWATASPSGVGTGWLATALDARRHPGPLVALGPGGCPAMEGGEALTLELSPTDLLNKAEHIFDPARAENNTVLRQMLTLEKASHNQLKQLRAQLAPVPRGIGLPHTAFGQQIALALRLIRSGRCPPVLQLAHGGFDTHANQARRHGRVLQELATGLAAFAAGLERLPNRPDVTLLTVSEFGRRLKENGSGGTDHGSASIALLMSEQITNPLMGAYPSLNELDNRGDLVPSITPVQLYEQVLSNMR